VREVEVQAIARRITKRWPRYAGLYRPYRSRKAERLLIAVPRSSLPKQDKDEYYWSDLIGLAW